METVSTEPTGQAQSEQLSDASAVQISIGDFEQKIECDERLKRIPILGDLKELLLNTSGGQVIVVLDKDRRHELPFNTLDGRRMLRLMQDEVGSRGLIKKAKRFTAIMNVFSAHTQTDRWTEGLVHDLANKLGYESAWKAPLQAPHELAVKDRVFFHQAESDPSTPTWLVVGTAGTVEKIEKQGGEVEVNWDGQAAYSVPWNCLRVRPLTRLIEPMPQPKDGAIILSSHGSVLAAAAHLKWVAPPGQGLQLLRADGTRAGTRHAAALATAQFLGREKILGIVMVRSDQGAVHVFVPQEFGNPLIWHISNEACESTITSMSAACGGVTMSDDGDSSCSHDFVRREIPLGSTLNLRGTDFVVSRELGAGGFGVVFALETLGKGQANAPQEQPTVSVAAKIVPQSRADSLVVEVLTAVILRRDTKDGHSFTPAVRGVAKTKCGRFLVLLMDEATRTLRSALQDGDGIEEKDAVLIAMAIGYTLRALHNVGLVHQDVKPENVLFSVGGTPMLADYGSTHQLAHWEGLPGSPLSQGVLVPRVAFTPRYAAPEVLIDGTVSLQSDIWSWAVLFLELLQVQLPPRPGRDAPGASHADWISKVVALMPENYALRDCLAFRPQDRPASMNDAIAQVFPSSKLDSSVDFFLNWGRELRAEQDRATVPHGFWCGELQKHTFVELQVLDALWDDTAIQNYVWKHVTEC